MHGMAPTVQTMHQWMDQWYKYQTLHHHMDAVQCDERRAGFAAHTKGTTLKPGVSIALHGGT